MPFASRILEKFLRGLGSWKGRPLLAAVSGGADSVCLLACLAELRPAVGYELSALHCDHGLRGAASRADAAVVKRLCSQFKVPLLNYRAKLAKGPGLEERARAWRRLCYIKAAKAKGSRYVFLGHHAGDQAETVLLNLIRGCGLAGAGGMRPLAPLEGAPTVKIARPWLETPAPELRADLKLRGLKWREDASNEDTALKRNALRREVLPGLERLLPGAGMRLAGFARRAAEAARVLEAVAERELKTAKSGKGWRVAALKALEPGLRRLVLRKLGGAVMDEGAVERAQRLLEKASGKADLRRGFALESKRGTLFLRKFLLIKA